MNSYSPILKKIQNDIKKEMIARHNASSKKIMKDMVNIVCDIIEKIASDPVVKNIIIQNNYQKEYMNLYEVWSMLHYFPKLINEKSLVLLRSFPHRYSYVFNNTTKWETKMKHFSQISLEFREKSLTYTGSNLFITNVGYESDLESSEIFNIINEFTTCIHVYKLSNNTFIACNLSSSETNTIVDQLHHRYLKYDDGTYSKKLQVSKIKENIQTRRNEYNWKYKLNVMCYYNYHFDTCIPIHTIVEYSKNIHKNNI